MVKKIYNLFFIIVLTLIISSITVGAIEFAPLPTPPTDPPVLIPNQTINTPTASTKSDLESQVAKLEAKVSINQTKVTQVTIKSKSKKKINVTWKKITKAKGYEVQVSKKKNFKKPIYDKFTKKTKLTIKKLKSKKTYFVRVRAYATYQDVNNNLRNVYGSWSKKTGKKIKVK